MTEHSKIPLPGEDQDKEPQSVNNHKPGSNTGPSDSLFERASGAFGFENFSAARVPPNLAQGPLKRARKVKRKGQGDAPVEGSAPHSHSAAPAQGAAPAQSAYMPQSGPQAPAGQPAGGTAMPHSGGAAPHGQHPESYAQPMPQNGNADGQQRAESLPVPVPVPPSEIMLAQGPSPIVFRGEHHHVDRSLLREKGIIVPEGAVSGLVEEFRIIKRAVMNAANMHGTAASRRILVCSPLPGEGKSFCAANLAVSLAGDHETEVLLVDADIAKPSVLSTFGLPQGPGLMDVIADPAIRIEDVVLGTDIPGLWVLPAGSSSRSDSEYLASARTGQVFDQLTMGAPGRIVIFDSPPALAASHGAELAKHVGQTLLVVRSDSTGQSALEDAYQLLSACPDVKLLLNAVQFSPSGRRFGSYYGYEG